MLNLVKMASFKGSNYLLQLPHFFLWDSKFYPLFLSFSPIDFGRNKSSKIMLSSRWINVMYTSTCMLHHNLWEIWYFIILYQCWICLTHRRPNSLDKNQFHQKSCDFFKIYIHLFQFWDVFADFPYFKVTILLKIIWTKSTCNL